jgi:hypothetical protein
MSVICGRVMARPVMILIKKDAIDEVCEGPDNGSLTDVESTHDWDQDARAELL